MKVIIEVLVVIVTALYNHNILSFDESKELTDKLNREYTKQ